MKFADDVVTSLFQTGDLAADTLSRLDHLQCELDRVRQELDSLRSNELTLPRAALEMEAELRLAAQLQRGFLPRTLPTIGEVRFQSLFRPATHVSGDLFDIFRLDEVHVGFYLADAIGHGTPAALLSMFLRTALETKEIHPAGYRLLDPAQTMARLNAALIAKDLAHSSFATALYGYIDTRTLELTVSCAGHPCPIILTREGSLRCIEIEGALLGVFPGESFQQRTVQLEPGDRVFAYSDGIEWACGDGQSPDTVLWQQQLEAGRDMPTDEILQTFGRQIDRAGKKDDLTIIAIEAQFRR